MTAFSQEIEYFDVNSILPNFQNESNLAFLDSAMQHIEIGRYSYLAMNPFLIMTSKNGIIHINNQKQSANDPFIILKRLLSLYKSEPISHLPPFQGGALGYFAYDLLHHLEKIPRARADIINIPDLYLGFYDCVLSFDHLQKRAFIVSQGFPEINPMQRQKHAKERAQYFFDKILEWKQQEKKYPSPNIDTKVRSNFTKEDYINALQETIDYIYAGDIFQANITQCFNARLSSNIKPIDLYIKLREQNPAPFAAFLNFDKICLASASPERFMSLQNKHIQTHPIKGTIKRGDSKEENAKLAQKLLMSIKDRAENTMIVDLMRNDLSKVSEDNSVEVTKLCNLESFSTVHHLVSEIKAKLSANKDAIDLLTACFPGGSITGAPKIRAMEIIYEIEPSQRAAYCGSIGYIGFDGNMDTSIVIRTYTIVDNNIYFQAGGGIVADSNPQAEYEESLLKAQALHNILQKKDELCDSHN